VSARRADDDRNLSDAYPPHSVPEHNATRPLARARALLKLTEPAKGRPKIHLVVERCDPPSANPVGAHAAREDHNPTHPGG
jgi:hypothetical protein